MQILVPQYHSAANPHGIIPPSPPAERRAEQRQKIRRLMRKEARTHTGRLLLPGNPEFEKLRYEVAGLVNGGRVNSGHGLVNGGLVRAGSTPSSLLTGLGEYWNMDESSGTRVGSHNATNASVVGTSVGSNTGKISNAAAFDGTSNYLKATSNANIKLTLGSSYTISWWFYIASFVDFSCVWVKQDNSATANSTEYEFILQSPGCTFVASIVGAQRSVSQAGALSTATWYYGIAGYNATKYSASEGALFLAINNGTKGFTSSGQTPNASWPLSATNPLNFGVYGDNNASFRFNGRIDEWGIWPATLLTDTQITNLYNSGTGITYPFTGVP